MTDHLGIFNHNAEDPQTGEVDVEQLREALQRRAGNGEDLGRSPRSTSGRREARARLAAARRRRKRTIATVILASTVLVAILIVGVALFINWRTESEQVADFTGAGDTETIVQIQRGDDLTAITSTLVGSEIVAGAEAFTLAATGNTAIAGLSPGYYKIREHSSAAAAVTALTSADARVGELRIVPGRRLADVTTVRDGTGDVVPGYISAITAASCVPLNAGQDCFTAEDLWQVARTADPATLGVVDWAIEEIRAAPQADDRLEGMIAPGDYDIKPGSTPLEALRSVIRDSSTVWTNSTIRSDAEALGITPYQAVVVASLVQAEGKTSDMRKVARVVYNRLADDMKLQFDSTINYGLGHAQLALTRAEIDDTSNVYNTYQIVGLPPTPIGSPGPEAVDAMLDPAKGKWLFFVKVDAEGNSCFSQTNAQHEECIAQAVANGVIDR